MTTDRIKEIQAETAYPNSRSVQQALLKVWNECEQGQKQVKNCSIPNVSVMSEHHCGNQLTDKELFHDHCLKCGEYISED